MVHIAAFEQLYIQVDPRVEGESAHEFFHQLGVELPYLAGELVLKIQKRPARNVQRDERGALVHRHDAVGKAGDALPAERTMAEIMGVSRPAVREALRALELLGIVKPVPGGGNYITEDLDTWLIEPLSILFKLNNGYLRQNQQFRAALEREAAILAARKCTPLDAAELWVILARLDAAEDEKIRGELDRELHKKIAKIADNPMVYSVLAAADQLTENIVSGTRDYIMKKNNSVREVDDQHHRLVKAIINGDVEQAERCMSEHMDTIERYMEEMQKKS